MLAVAVLSGTSPIWCQSHTVQIGDSSLLIHYDTALLIARSVEWVLSPEFLGNAKRKASWKFTQDDRLKAPQASHEDYTHSGYDRGHMCPASDRSRSISSMKQTFVVTNICPQAPALNRGAWEKIENDSRRYAANGIPLRIQACPVFWLADTQFIGRHRVAVPHGFVKTIRLLSTDSIIFSRYFTNQ